MADLSKIFALGAQKQAQTLVWRDFEGNFSETTFMDNVMMPAMLKEPSLDWDGKLDISRIRGILNVAKDQVMEVKNTVSTMIVDQSEKCKGSEKTLQSDCDSLYQNLEGLENSYKVINDKYTTVSSTSTAVGKTLKSLNEQTERATKTKRLLSNFLSFQENENHMQEMLLSNDQLLQGSNALQELVMLSEGLDKEEYGVVIDRINGRVQSVVNMLVDSLQEATMNNNLQDLAVITSCLSTFQKGVGVFQTYTHVSIKKIQTELEKIELGSDKMFDDYVVFISSYFMKMGELIDQEIGTVYEIFDKDAVCQVLVTIIDRLFNDSTIGLQFVIHLLSASVTLSKEEKFEMLAQTREGSYRFLTTTLDHFKSKEKSVIGHAERVVREEKGLWESLDNAFTMIMDEYFSDELLSLNVSFKDTIANAISINVGPASSKSEIKNALKVYSDNTSEQMIQQFLTSSLSPITILELFNSSSRTLNILAFMDSS